MTAQTSAALQALGRSRATPMDQRIYLTELFTSACNILNMGVNGIYENAFFGQINTKAAVDGAESVCRLRAVVQCLNMHFAERMRTMGHRYLIEEDETSKAPGDAIIEDESDTVTSDDRTGVAKRTSRNEAIQWVIDVMRRTRGRELPGTFNPMLVGHLFQDQSEHWEGLARSHITSIASSCRAFVLHVLDQVAASEVKTRLLSLTVLPALKSAQEAALGELELIIEDKRRHPMTYNH